MKRFSVATLLWFVCICSVIVAIVITQRSLRQNEIKLAAALNDVATYRDELGELEVTDPNRYHIRYFQDPYGSYTEFRWRIYVPDASKCSLFFKSGVLPADGLPDNPRQLNKNRQPPGPAELILVVEYRRINEERGSFRVGFEIDDNHSVPKYALIQGSVDWMPSVTDTFENPSLEETTIFDLDQPFVIMKHYSTTEGELNGYMFWIEEF